MKYITGGNRRDEERERDLEMSFVPPVRQASSTMSAATTMVEAGRFEDRTRGTDGNDASIAPKVGTDAGGGDALIWTGMR